jgi:hypothetical protein
VGGVSGGGAATANGGSAGRVESAAGGMPPSSAGGTGNIGGMGNVGGNVVAKAGAGDVAEAGAGASDAGGAGGADAGRTCVGSDIDLTVTTVSGKLSVNGGALTDTNQADGALALINAAGDYASLGSLVGSSYSGLVVPGTYDLYYSNFAGTALPSGAVKLRSDVVVGTSPLSQDVAIATTHLSTRLTLNGKTPPDDGSKGDGNAFLELRRGTQEYTWIAYMISGAQASVVAPGTYDVYYSVYSRTPGGVPTNTSAKIQSGVVIDGSSAALAIDVPATPVSVSVTVAGAPITGATPELTFLTLKNDAGDTAELTVTSSAGDSSALVVPGTYDLYYGVYGEACIPPATCSEREAFAPNVPKNAAVKLKSGVVVGNSPLALEVDLPATRVSGTVSVNGGVADGLDGPGLLTLTTGAGDFVELSPDATGAYSELVLPGTYDLIYRINYDPPIALGVLPANYDTKLGSDIVVGASPLMLDIDIPMTTVSGTMTLNGVTLPPSAGKTDGDGAVALSNADGARAGLGSLRAGSFSAAVIPGTYDLVYAVMKDPFGNIGAGVPINGFTTFERGVVVGTSTPNLIVDVPAVTISGAVTSNGIAPADPEKDGAGALTLVNADGNTTLASIPSSSADPSSAAKGAYSALLIPGAYELYYQDYFVGPSVPGNERVDLGCFDVR